MWSQILKYELLRNLGMYRALYPRQIVLIVSSDSRPNIMPAAWVMPTSFDPAMVAISIGTTRYTHKLISRKKEFVIAVPSEDMLDKVLRAGSCSGRDTDKLRETGLTAVRASKVAVPLIKECQVNIECALVGSVRTGDHTIFIGKVLAVHGRKRKKTIVDMGGRRFAGL
jgi:flavin reductase (DIM6/NTAB) family NADH-FMN oxidoreductase RutF